VAHDGGWRRLAVEGGFGGGARWRTAAVEGGTKTSERRRESAST
jgi:hypothetical protein